ncbi:Dol-P-Glc:Glc-PP-Dol alpha-1,2-glucosyltransferase [Erysiphe neolycopersici]|uniref:Dol-P-Glc:Glc(2)Man(9)GlcNAc(2)-PP-Dol alpha-1,2-glucosyltransferase n=1 Tax=Erysiphe neolycopersici TaxID=212602 RepID=A0A420HQ04_9PEZI|nr:Dol-P-Glc:Glc-PP-Dol alpha-1,2-glucosyltransferase [Erysiphe neolycopersici]
MDLLKISSIITFLSISFYLIPFKKGSSNIIIIVVSGILYFLILLWENYVTKIVPDPYLDEVFHIPQAQAYCDGRFDVWDSKLTTPPGLYILASFKVLIFQKFRKISCDVHTLRSLNGVALLITFLYACNCRLQITQSCKDVIHTAFNIALFPPLFFFSGLFYTDVISVCFVLIAYKLVLDRKKGVHNYYNTLSLLITGIISLTIRQTNIFWTAIFLGATDLVNALELKEIQTGKPLHYNDGRLNNILLNQANLLDYVYFTLKTFLVALNRPGLVVKQIWPFITLLVLFTSFVLWNGSVVLGDKSNHVAMIHLPQMLYIWPFITFFSAPLIIPIGIKILFNMKIFFLEAPKIFGLYQKHRKTWCYTFVALLTSVLIVRYNTIIHPFILADNRHYMFYIFRYTILRHPKIRFFLVPIYLICSCFTYLTLCNQTLRLQKFKVYDQKTVGRVNGSVFSSSTRYEGPKISFVLILLITTTLSLITCPLVETRYFIVPWVLWRLNVPLAFNQSRALRSNVARTTKGIKSRIVKILDYILWLETLWLLLINFGIGYTFLHQGFEWPQEPGLVQRFIW